MFTFGVKGGFEAGVKLVESVRLFSHLANIGDTRSLILHPASTTHRQLTDEQRVAAGAGDDVVRLSIGLETADDLIRDLDQALAVGRITDPRFGLVLIGPGRHATVPALDQFTPQQSEETMAQSQPCFGARRGPRRRPRPDRATARSVLFGEVWERPGLSKRDRSLIVVATLIALGREKQLVGHLSARSTTASPRTRSARSSPISPSTPAGRRR